MTPAARPVKLPPGQSRTEKWPVLHYGTADLPLAALLDDDVLLAWSHDGKPLTPDHGWPCRLAAPTRYFWKSAKWVRGIEVMRDEQPGF